MAIFKGDDILILLLKTLRQHNYDTFLHSKRVASVSILIGEKVELTEAEINDLMTTALLHDIGKIKIPTETLNKDTPLSKEEIALIKNHPLYGVDLTQGYSEKILNSIKYHHEFFNGNGYPYKLKGESIPVFSRIIAIADALDAMTKPRPYRKTPLSHDEAWGEIEIHSGSQFDPYIVRKIEHLPYG